MRCYVSPSLVEAGTIRTFTQLDGPLGAEDEFGSSLVPPGAGDPFPT